MQKKSRMYGIAFASVGLLALAGPAMASETLSMSELNDVRAGDSLVVTNTTTNQIVSADLSGPATITAGQIDNGAISFTENAFSNFGGIANVLANTGNNNIIQGVLSVAVVSAATP